MGDGSTTAQRYSENSQAVQSPTVEGIYERTITFTVPPKTNRSGPPTGNLDNRIFRIQVSWWRRFIREKLSATVSSSLKRNIILKCSLFSIFISCLLSLNWSWKCQNEYQVNNFFQKSKTKYTYSRYVFYKVLKG